MGFLLSFLKIVLNDDDKMNYARKIVPFPSLGRSRFFGKTHAPISDLGGFEALLVNGYCITDDKAGCPLLPI